jgi:hypothetical protein
MALFSRWCAGTRDEDGRKRLWTFTEKAGGRDRIRNGLFKIVRSHYDSLKRIADDVEELGYGIAAKILRERLPSTKRARSGELGEILASELVEEELNFNIPVRRLRYKDGRELALRGDDFIGVRYDEEHGLRLLKGESKSRKVLNDSTIAAARKALNRNNGRCSPSSLLFVADRLLEKNGEDAELGRAIRNEVGTKALRPRQIDHVLFTLSGNKAPTALKDDLEAADGGRKQTAINVCVEDHQDFIAEIYEGAGNLGDD